MSRHALVVGAGVAGLGAAWWLSSIGWRITVIERAPDLRTDGYMLGLSGPGYEVAGRMGLMPVLRERERPIEENLHLDRDGREVLRLRYRDFLKGLDWVTLSRSDLAEVLHDAVRDRADIRFGTTLAAYEDHGDGVVATLSDGTTVAADLLIGADGVNSRLRATLFGERPEFRQHLGYRVAAFQTEDTLGLGRDFLSYVEPGRIAEFYTLAEGRLATLYIWRTDETAPIAAEHRRDALLAAFAGAHPDAMRWIEDMAPDAPLFFDTMTMIDLPAWSRGRALLLGDAAHCLTLISGQGAGIALTSACVLSEELATGDIDGALVRHAERVRPSVEALQQRSRRMAAWFLPATPFAFRLRHAILRNLPRPLLAWYFRRGVRSEILAASPDADKAARRA